MKFDNAPLAPLASLTTAALISSISVSAFAQQYTIDDIRFSGLQATSAELAYNYLPLQPGQKFGPEAFPSILSALRGSGLFESVEITPTDDILLISAQEAGTVGQINVSGARAIKADEIRQLLADGGIVEGSALSPNALARAERILQEAYAARGKYSVSTTVDTSPLSANRSAINVRINEGGTSKIRTIKFTGNNTYSDGRLRSQMRLKQSGMTTWLSKRDIYDDKTLEADMEAVKQFYFNRGYINAQVGIQALKISEDQRDILVDIGVSEGDRYRINSISFAGSYPVTEESLISLVEIPRGEVYDQREVNQLTSDVADKLGDYGYAQAKINIDRRLDETNKTVDLIYNIEGGGRVYVRRINFAGNTTTEDAVLRNRMRQSETSWFSSRDIKQSRRNLERLGYFKNIDIKPVPVNGTEDQVDLNVNVEEALTSSIRGGIGYGQDAGVLFNFEINQRNFRGSGQDISAGLTYSAAEKGLNLSITDPYFTKNGVSQTIYANYSETDPNEINKARYLADEGSIGVRYGFPINEDDTFYLGAGLEYYDFTTGTNTPQEIKDFVADKGDSSILNYKLSASFAKDTRDRTLFPTKGTYSRIGLEASTPGSDDTYVRGFASTKAYYSLGEYAVLKGELGVGIGEGYGDTDALPFYKNYFTGGSGSVRGFKGNSLGPRYNDTNSVKGGAFETTANIALVTPFALAPNDESLKTEFFVDAGNVFPSVSDFDAGEIRYAAGVGLQYYSPFGVIAVSYAKALNDEPGDETQPFQFSIGTSY